MDKVKDYKYHMMSLLTVVVWGITFVSTKVLIRDGLSPAEIFFYRFLLAYIGIWFIAPKILWADSLKHEFLFLLLGFVGGSFYFITENTALGITLASNVSLIICTAPVLTAILSRMFNKSEKLSKNLMTGSILALAGVALVVFNGSFVLQINPLGDFLTLLSSLSWASYGLILKKLEAHYSITFITRKIFFYGIITIIPVFYFHPLHFNFNILFKTEVISNLLFLGIIASLFCFVMWNSAVKKLGVVRTTNYIYMVPLVTLGASVIFLKEPLTLVALVGAVFILLGVYIAEKGFSVFNLKGDN